MRSKIVLSLVFGMLLGMGIEAKLNEKSEEVQSELTKAYEDLITAQYKQIKFYAEYVKNLEEEYIDYYKDAFDEMLNKYIELKKKLKAYE